jgi:hypothetical protein
MRQVEKPTAETFAAVKCELATEVLCSFGTLRFAATGWSMLPSLWPGETLIVERVRPDHVKVGEIVLVRREGTLRAHRLIGTAGDAKNPQWITQGDALGVPDPPVAGEDLLGRVAYLIRAGRCIPVPAELSVVENLLAKIVRRSVPAARALVYLHRMVQTAEEPVLPARG